MAVWHAIRGLQGFIEGILMFVIEGLFLCCRIGFYTLFEGFTYTFIYMKFFYRGIACMPVGIGAKRSQRELYIETLTSKACGRASMKKPAHWRAFVPRGTSWNVVRMDGFASEVVIYQLSGSL